MGKKKLNEKVAALPDAPTRDSKKELDAAHARIDELTALLEKERGRNVVKFAGAKTGKRRGLVRVTFGDSHGMRIDNAAAAALIADLKLIQPHEIIHGGDVLDCDGFLSSHKAIAYTSLSDYSYDQDIGAANDFLDAIQKAAPSSRFDLIEGNHECLTADHDVLTPDGWLPIWMATVRQEVASMSEDGSIAWQHPTACIERHHDGIVYEISGRSISARMTPGHRILHYRQKRQILQFRTAESLAAIDSKLRVPANVSNPNPELQGYSDDEIRLAAWILTDGWISATVGISQSKPEGIDKVKSILEWEGIDYRLKVRDRKPPKSILGVSVKTARVANEFIIRSHCARPLIKKLFGMEWHYSHRGGKPMPEFVRRLSARQFDVFYEAMIDGDGSRVKKLGGTVDCLYGKRETLEWFQQLLVVNGKRAFMAERKRNGKRAYDVLNINDSKTSEITSINMQATTFRGQVYCLEMPADNFIVRHKGKVHVTGNCRVRSWCKDNSKNDRDMQYHWRNNGPPSVLSLEKRGITWYSRGEKHDGLSKRGTIKRGKMLYVHGDSHAANAGQRHLIGSATNVTYFHTHRADVQFTSTEASGVIGAFNSGCLCERHPMWRHSEPSNWSQGYGLEFVRPDGDFLKFVVPIIEGQSLLGPLLKMLKV